MASVAVVGTQWGDEGKGKIVDLLAEKFDVVARYQGGHNAGHTVMLDGRRMILHLLPTGILHPDKRCIIGNGVVVDPKALLSEIDALTREGIDVSGRLFVSLRAHVILPYHRRVDQENNRAQGLRCLGTTGRGIGPTYTDKMARTGITVADLFDREIFWEKLELNIKRRHLEGVIDPQPIFEEYLELAECIAPYVADTAYLLNDWLDEGAAVLFEGAQGTLLDVDHGTYPYVTSSSATVGGVCTGLGIGPTRLDGVLGVAKAYTTRVGHGPFPTELHDELGRMLRQNGDEYGATTGRPRRCGWFDAVAVAYAVRINGIQSLAVTKLDVLDSCQTIKICVGYEWQGQKSTQFPARLREVKESRPIYEEWPGWLESTQGITSYRDLPAKTKAYLERIEELAGAKISIISTGPHRHQTIFTADATLKSWLER